MKASAITPPVRRPMKYVNREFKIDQIIGYFNDRKINLIPPFQRGSVWKLPLRKKLLENMVQERPIPAIFLYKQESGSQFSYNILDGKQRLESLLLFIGDKRSDMKINNVKDYFEGKPQVYADVNFSIELDEQEVRFKDLDDSIIRKFREYGISVIDIDLDEEKAALDEVINLFIDINQKGVKVSRFEMVKALVKDKMFKQVFALIARKKDKRKSTYYKALANSSFVQVLTKLSIVEKLSDENSKVDRMWERLTEIALFAKDGQHRAPAAILKSFINIEKDKPPHNMRLTEDKLTKLRHAFGFLAQAYRNTPELAATKLATDQPQFYTLITTLISTDLLDKYEREDLETRILSVAEIIEKKRPAPDGIAKAIRNYRSASSKHTTDPGQRSKRQKALIEALEGIGDNKQ